MKITINSVDEIWQQTLGLIYSDESEYYDQPPCT